MGSLDRRKHKIIFLLFVSLTIGCSVYGQDYIRLNMLGYLCDDPKIAIVGSSSDLKGEPFYIVNSDDNNQVVYKGTISSSRGSAETPFKYNLPCDFSDLKKEGNYKLKLDDGTLSNSFTIGASDEYENALASIMDFFRSQRCGDTNPILHDPCHLNDKNAAIDVSGGWHDAGDYIKYMITITFATVELLTAADYAMTYNFDFTLIDESPANGIPDLLDETKIGLDWILKMTSGYADEKYYYQVSGEEDHSGWRLPETDDTTRDLNSSRSLHEGWGGNILGRSAASLAIAARTYNTYDKKFAQKCLERAEALFAQRNNYEHVQKSNPEEFYNEKN